MHRSSGCTTAISVLIALFCTSSSRAQYWSSQNPPPTSGEVNADLASFDRMMLDFMVENQVPGAAMAVSRAGRVVYARGFGWADVAGRQPVEPRSLFRIASLTKPITAAAIMRLVEDKKLALDAPAFSLMPFKLRPLTGQTPEPRLGQVTILELLQHRGGWDRDKSFDPMFRSREIAQKTGIKPPALQENIINYMQGIPLDFPPGGRYAYSNFGYCVLGRIIEKAGQLSYEEFVKRSVLQPLGITDMKLGHTRLAERADDEVHYYDRAGASVASLFTQDNGRKVPPAYGDWCLEAMDAHGGWLGSAPDLVRFAAAFDDSRRRSVVKPSSLRTMFQRPTGEAGFEADGTPKAVYYGCGWQVRPVGKTGKFNAWHTGLLRGCCSTLLVRRYDGTDWAVFFNIDTDPKGQTLADKIDPLVHVAADAVKRWPAKEVAFK